MQKTAIIVPCFNEALRLKVKDFLDCVERNKSLYFIFVNDGSTDNTQEIINELCQSKPLQILSIHFDKNRGKAEAVRAGFLKAMEIEFINIGFWDADLSTPINEIEKFCKILESPRINLVMGSRVRLLGRNINRHIMRHYIGRVFATLVSILLRIPVYDTQCGAKLFKNTKELKYVFSRPFIVKWTFDVEILARLIMINKATGTPPLVETVVEYPLKEWSDVPGSKLKLRDFIIAPYEFFRIYLILYGPNASRHVSELMSV